MWEGRQYLICSHDSCLWILFTLRALMPIGSWFHSAGCQKAWADPFRLSARKVFFKIRLGTKRRTQTWKLQKHLLAGRSKRIQNRGCTPTHRFRWLRPWWPTWWCCRSRAWQCPPAGRWGTACKIGRNISFRLVSILWSLMPKLILNSSCSGTGRPYGLAGAQRLLMQAP